MCWGWACCIDFCTGLFHEDIKHPKEKKRHQTVVTNSQWKNSNVTENFSDLQFVFILSSCTQAGGLYKRGLKAKVTRGAKKQEFKYCSLPVFQALSIILQGQKEDTSSLSAPSCQR